MWKLYAGIGVVAAGGVGALIVRNRIKKGSNAASKEANKIAHVEKTIAVQENTQAFLGKISTGLSTVGNKIGTGINNTLGSLKANNGGIKTIFAPKPKTSATDKTIAKYSAMVAAKKKAGIPIVKAPTYKPGRQQMV